MITKQAIKRTFITKLTELRKFIILNLNTLNKFNFIKNLI